jgi:hypothetical protein
MKTLIHERNTIQKIFPFFYFLFGSIFGLGLLISGMCSQKKILSFLVLSPDWDPSLMFVMATAVCVNLITFQYTIANGCAILCNKIDLPDKGIGLNVILGSALFGVGWGLTGFCPGPAMANITISVFALPLIVAIFSGQLLVEWLK